jgi:hypothetical protein
MSFDMFLFVLAVGLFLVLLLGLAILFYRRRSRHALETTWEQLLSRLIDVDRNGVETIALDAIDRSGQRRHDEHAMELESEQIWRLIGGLKGIEALEHNSHVLIEMAAYLQRWYPEALVTAEELRLSAREIEWHVSRLRAGSESGNLMASFGSYAQNAVATYYLMTRQLLALYERGDISMFGDLQRAL